MSYGWAKDADTHAQQRYDNMHLDLWDLSLRAAAARRLGQPHVVLDEVEAALFTRALGGLGWPTHAFGVSVRVIHPSPSAVRDVPEES
jgi:hypothetical protein